MSPPNIIKAKLAPLRSLLTLTKARSTTLSWSAIGGLPHCNTAANIAGTPNAKESPEEPSQIVQACYKLPKNKAFSTFLYRRISSNEIPTGWSNAPAVLEMAIDLHTSLKIAYGQPLQAPMPIAVKLVAGLAGQERFIRQYLFEAGGIHYIYSEPSCYPPYGVVQRVTKPVRLEILLQVLRTEGERALEKVTLEKPSKSNLTELKKAVMGMMNRSEADEVLSPTWKQCPPCIKHND